MLRISINHVIHLIGWNYSRNLQIDLAFSVCRELVYLRGVWREVWGIHRLGYERSSTF